MIQVRDQPASLLVSFSSSFFFVFLLLHGKSQWCCDEESEREQGRQAGRQAGRQTGRQAEEEAVVVAFLEATTRK